MLNECTIRTFWVDNHSLSIYAVIHVVSQLADIRTSAENPARKLI